MGAAPLIPPYRPRSRRAAAPHQAGASGVHFEDQLASAKKCGHLGGKVLVPTKEFVAKLQVRLLGPAGR